MKDNRFLSGLMSLLLLSVAATAVLSFLNVRSLGEAQRLQFQRAIVGRNLNLFQALLNDTVEYGKRNPAIMPILQSQLSPSNAPAAAPAPAPAKPAPASPKKK